MMHRSNNINSNALKSNHNIKAYLIKIGASKKYLLLATCMQTAIQKQHMTYKTIN